MISVLNMNKDEAKGLIRECLNEIIQKPHYVPDRALKIFGDRTIDYLVSRGVAIEKWDIYEQDRNTVIFQLYFKLIRQKELGQLLTTLVGTYNGELRMYPEKNFVGVDVKIDKKNM